MCIIYIYICICLKCKWDDLVQTGILCYLGWFFFLNNPASREMLDRRWANVVTYVGATSANYVGPMWICPSVQRWHNVVTPPTMTLCQRFANVITYCILLYFMVIGTTFAQCLYEWLAKHWHNFMKQWCPLYVFLYSHSLSPIACRRLRLR